MPANAPIRLEVARSQGKRVPAAPARKLQRANPSPSIAANRPPPRNEMRRGLRFENAVAGAAAFVATFATLGATKLKTAAPPTIAGLGKRTASCTGSHTGWL